MRHRSRSDDLISGILRSLKSHKFAHQCHLVIMKGWYYQRADTGFTRDTNMLRYFPVHSGRSTVTQESGYHGMILASLHSKIQLFLLRNWRYVRDLAANSLCSAAVFDVMTLLHWTQAMTRVTKVQDIPAAQNHIG